MTKCYICRRNYDTWRRKGPSFVCISCMMKGGM